MRKQKILKKRMALILSACLIGGMTVPAAAASITAEDAIVSEAGEKTRTAATVVASGECGANAQWRLESDGTFYITGSGDMADYEYDYTDDEGDIDTPWKNYLTKIKSVRVSQGITGIGNLAFCCCENLSKVDLPESVIDIGKDAFGGCDISKIELPEGLKNISSGAFSGCHLSMIDLPEGITRIEDSVFEGCDKLSKIVLPDGITSIGDFAFNMCNGLTEIVMPDGITSIGDMAFGECTNLSEINLPKSLKSINDDVFDGCIRLSRVNLPDGITSIGYCAFGNCWALKKIELPEKLSELAERAFYGCDSLTSVVMKASNAPKCHSKAFESVAKDLVFYVPEGADGYDVKPWTNYKVVYGDGSSAPEVGVKSVKLSAAKYTYNGKTKKPSIKATDTKGKKISSKYYKVTYSKGRKNVGQYTVTVTFKGKYSGTVTETFTIVPKGTSLSKLSAKKNGFKATWKKQATQTSGYEMQYATDKKFADAETVQVSGGKKTSTSVTELQAKKKYYVRVRTYKTAEVDGESTILYSSWSKAKSVKTKG